MHEHAKENNLEVLSALTANLPFPRGSQINNEWYEYEMEEGTCHARDLYSTPDVSVTLWKNSAGSKFPVHTHKELEIIGLYKGSAEIHFGDGYLVDLQSESAIVISPEREHRAFFPVESEYITIMIPASLDYPTGAVDDE